MHLNMVGIIYKYADTYLLKTHYNVNRIPTSMYRVYIPHILACPHYILQLLYHARVPTCSSLFTLNVVPSRGSLLTQHFYQFVRPRLQLCNVLLLLGLPNSKTVK